MNFIRKTNVIKNVFLKRLCKKIAPEKRIAVVVIMFLLLSIATISIFAKSIYNIGKNDGQRIELEHIKHLQLQHNMTNDSIYK